MDYAGDLTLEVSDYDLISVRSDSWNDKLFHIGINCYKSNDVLLLLPLKQAQILQKELGKALKQTKACVFELADGI